MRSKLPKSRVQEGHRDFPLLSKLLEEILEKAGGKRQLFHSFPLMLRECIDSVIQTAKTGRRSYSELEKTEKTYIGTRVEIELRALLNLPKGKLDTVLAGHDVDIKHTMGGNWMIPNEAVDHACMLVAADEEQELCYFGLIVARPEYLTKGSNRDAKRTVSVDGFKNILWILVEEHYPPNFWKTVSDSTTYQIVSGLTGNARVGKLFAELQEIPIGRDVIDAVARQKDFTRRIRSDGKSGTRDILASQGITILSGTTHSNLIEQFGLPKTERSEWISYSPKGKDEIEAARLAGFNIPSM